MDPIPVEVRRPTLGPLHLPFYYGWVNVAVDALAGNFLGGWLASKWRMTRLLAMALLACSLLALPHVRTEAHVAAYAV